MKERSLPPSPLTGAKRAAQPTFHPVGQSCRFAPTKKLSCLPMLPSKNPDEPNWEGRRVAVLIPALPWKNPHEPNSFPETQPAPGTLHFLSVSIGVHPWFKNLVFEGI
jgi:hypothetical protein